MILAKNELDNQIYLFPYTDRHQSCKGHYENFFFK